MNTGLPAAGLPPPQTGPCRTTGSRFGRRGGLPHGLQAAGLLPPALLARLLVVLVGSQLALHPAPLDELLEPPQGGPDRLPLVNPHSQTHSDLLGFRPASVACPAGDDSRQ